MGKIFLVDLPHEFGVRGLIGDGKMLKFKFNGTCLGEFPIDYNVTGMQEVDIISILVSNGNGGIEIGYNSEQSFTKQTTLMGLAEVARTISNVKGLVFAGQRNGQEGELTYSQYIYAFLRGYITPETVR